MNRFRSMVMLAVASISFPVQAHQFAIEAVDAESRLGFLDNTDTALDSLGRQGICYRDEDRDVLKYAHYDGISWTVETADGGDGNGHSLGHYCSIVFDAADRPHILYYDMTDDRLLHTRKNGGVWATLVADADARADFLGASRLSAAIAPNGTIAVAYFEDAGRDLRYAEYDGAAWVSETVVSDGNVGKYPGLAFDSDGLPSVVYVESVDDTHALIRFIEHDGLDWMAPVTIDADAARGGFEALEFDGDDVPHVAYQAIAANGVQSLRYANRRNGLWSAPWEVASGGNPGAWAGYQLGMAVGPDHDVHLVFQQDFLSALFGRSRYLKFVSLYFTDQGNDGIGQTTQNLAVNFDFSTYCGMSAAIDDDFNLVMSWADEDWDGNFKLQAAVLSDWEPAILLQTPDAGENIGADAFRFSWRAFDPDGDADVRLYYRDEDFNTNAFAGTYPAAVGHAEVSLEGVEEGNYPIEARISDDDFAMYYGSGSPRSLTVDLPDAPVVVDVIPDVNDADDQADAAAEAGVGIADVPVGNDDDSNENDEANAEVGDDSEQSIEDHDEPDEEPDAEENLENDGATADNDEPSGEDSALIGEIFDGDDKSDAGDAGTAGLAGNANEADPVVAAACSLYDGRAASGEMESMCCAVFLLVLAGFRVRIGCGTGRDTSE